MKHRCFLTVINDGVVVLQGGRYYGVPGTRYLGYMYLVQYRSRYLSSHLRGMVTIPGTDDSPMLAPCRSS